MSITRAAVFVFLLMLLSCEKEDVIVDCFGESLLVLLKYDIDAATPRQVKFEVEYSGTNDLEHIIWHFGDGKSADGPDIQVNHTYAAPGIYSVMADVHIKTGKALCTVSPKKEVTLN